MGYKHGDSCVKKQNIGTLNLIVKKEDSEYGKKHMRKRDHINM